MALDGVRGLAIILVMLHHFTLYGGMKPTSFVDKVYYALTYAGWCGVDLFFVLSGFLITGILWDSKGSHGYFRNFYMRRVLRIFPLYFGFLALWFLVLPVVLPGIGTKAGGVHTFWYWTYTVNLAIAHGGWPPDLYIGHFWSLAVEEQFYIFWPLVVLLLSRRRLFGLCAGILLGALLLRAGLGLTGHSLAAYVLMPARMDALAAGALVALLAAHERGRELLRRFAPACFLVGVGALLLIVASDGGVLDTERPIVYTFGFALLAIVFAAMVAGAGTFSVTSAVHRFFSMRFLRFFGKYSYALYVVHHPIVIWLMLRGVSVDDFPTLLGSQFPGQLAFMMIAGVPTLGVAMLSWRLYESQFLKLKRFFPSRIRAAEPLADRPVDPLAGPAATNPQTSKPR